MVAHDKFGEDYVEAIFDRAAALVNSVIDQLAVLLIVAANRVVAVVDSQNREFPPVKVIFGQVVGNARPVVIINVSCGSLGRVVVGGSTDV